MAVMIFNTKNDIRDPRGRSRHLMLLEFPLGMRFRCGTMNANVSSRSLDDGCSDICIYIQIRTLSICIP